MCWQPKISTPKVQAPAAAPAPLTETPKSIAWGGDDDDTSGESSPSSAPKSGRGSLKIKLDSGKVNSKNKSAIRSKAFGK